MNIKSIYNPDLLDNNGQWRLHLTTNKGLTHHYIQLVDMHLVHHNHWVCHLVDVGTLVAVDQTVVVAMLQGVVDDSDVAGQLRRVVLSCRQFSTGTVNQLCVMVLV